MKNTNLYPIRRIPILLLWGIMFLKVSPGLTQEGIWIQKADMPTVRLGLVTAVVVIISYLCV